MSLLTKDQLDHGISLRRFLDEQKARQIAERIGVRFEGALEAVREGNELLDVEEHGNNSQLKRQLDARAQLMLNVERWENAALKMAIRILGKVNL
jgi:hypothetical protein